MESHRPCILKEESVMQSLKIILLSSAFNGLTQRAWLDLRQSGHEPSVVLFTDEATVCRQIEESAADLVICPFQGPRTAAALEQCGPPGGDHSSGDRGRSWRQRPGLGHHPAGQALGRHRVAGGGGDGRRPGLVDL